MWFVNDVEAASQFFEKGRSKPAGRLHTCIESISVMKSLLLLLVGSLLRVEAYVPSKAFWIV